MDPKEKARRLKEKAFRKPLNDVILDVQKGIIDIDELFKNIEIKVKEKANG